MADKQIARIIIMPNFTVKKIFGKMDNHFELKIVAHEENIDHPIAKVAVCGSADVRIRLEVCQLQTSLRFLIFQTFKRGARPGNI